MWTICSGLPGTRGRHRPGGLFRLLRLLGGRSLLFDSAFLAAGGLSDFSGAFLPSLKLGPPASPALSFPSVPFLQARRLSLPGLRRLCRLFFLRNDFINHSAGNINDVSGAALVRRPAASVFSCFGPLSFSGAGASFTGGEPAASLAGGASLPGAAVREWRGRSWSVPPASILFYHQPFN